MTDQMTPKPGPQSEVVPEDQAKQGRRGLHILWVLGISIALIVVAYLAIYALNVRQTTDTGAKDAAQRTATATKSVP